VRWFFAVALLFSGLSHAQNFVVDLTWDAPIDSPDPVAGYNVYRQLSGGTSWTLLTSSPLNLSVTAYTDLNVLDGLTYDYMVESVDLEGVASPQSNVAVVPIPGAPPLLLDVPQSFSAFPSP
jgi:fibronectin type 3 domain-containing protein